MRRSLVLAAFAATSIAATALALTIRARSAPPAKAPPTPSASAQPERPIKGPALDNLAAYLPAQCYAVTKDAGSGRTHNGCFACHQDSRPPNYADDADVQTSLSLPRFATQNRWANL